MRIQFDPSYKEEDWICRSHTSQLTITYKEHPHIDYINLMGEVVFPNLKFEDQNIDFGCILNDTEMSKYVTVTNTSRLTVNYEWYFNIRKQPKFLPGMLRWSFFYCTWQFDNKFQSFYFSKIFQNFVLACPYHNNWNTIHPWFLITWILHSDFLMLYLIRLQHTLPDSHSLCFVHHTWQQCIYTSTRGNTTLHHHLQQHPTLHHTRSHCTVSHFSFSGHTLGSNTRHCHSSLRPDPL